MALFDTAKFARQLGEQVGPALDKAMDRLKPILTETIATFTAAVDRLDVSIDALGGRIGNTNRALARVIGELESIDGELKRQGKILERMAPKR